MAFDASSQPKTLADMTAEERANCVGMWCDGDWSDGDSEDVGLCILVSSHRPIHGMVIAPEYGRGDLLEWDMLTPRFDLPRAWTPDGDPVPLAREYGNGGWEEDLGEPYHWPMRSRACNEYCSPFDKAPAEYSRWVSDWEPAPAPRKVNGMVNPHV